jgi:hypothetical protein
VATVLADGHRIQIPLWMLEPRAAAFELSGVPQVEISALRIVSGLLESVHRAAAAIEDPEHAGKKNGLPGRRAWRMGLP